MLTIVKACREATATEDLLEDAEGVREARSKEPASASAHVEEDVRARAKERIATFGEWMS